MVGARLFLTSFSTCTIGTTRTSRYVFLFLFSGLATRNEPRLLMILIPATLLCCVGTSHGPVFKVDVSILLSESRLIYIALWALQGCSL